MRHGDDEFAHSDQTSPGIFQLMNDEKKRKTSPAADGKTQNNCSCANYLKHDTLAVNSVMKYN